MDNDYKNKQNVDKNIWALLIDVTIQQPG